MAKSFIARRLEQLPAYGATIAYNHRAGPVWISDVRMAGQVFTRVRAVDGEPRHFQGALDMDRAADAYHGLAEAVEP